jgi:hypothetical protein
LLVLLYAQGVTAISLMTISQLQVSDQAVRLHLGRAPIQLPDPVAELARAVAANRKGHATIGTASPSPWLLPGGQPGRPFREFEYLTSPLHVDEEARAEALAGLNDLLTPGD